MVSILMLHVEMTGDRIIWGASEPLRRMLRIRIVQGDVSWIGAACSSLCGELVEP